MGGFLMVRKKWNCMAGSCKRTKLQSGKQLKQSIHNLKKYGSYMSISVY